MLYSNTPPSLSKRGPVFPAGLPRCSSRLASSGLALRATRRVLRCFGLRTAKNNTSKIINSKGLELECYIPTWGFLAHFKQLALGRAIISRRHEPGRYQVKALQQPNTLWVYIFSAAGAITWTAEILTKKMTRKISSAAGEKMHQMGYLKGQTDQSEAREPNGENLVAS